MKLYVIWRSSLKSIKNNKKRSFLTTFGIIIGIASVIAIMAIGRGFEKDTIKNFTNNETEEVEVNIQFIPDSESLYQSNAIFFQDMDLNILKSLDGVKKVSYPDNDNNSVYKDILVKEKTEKKQIDLVDETNREIVIGRNLSKVDNETHNKVAILDSNTAKDIYESPENSLEKGVEVEGQLFTIVGVYKGQDVQSMFSMPESNILIPKNVYFDYFEKENTTSMIVLTLENGYAPNEVTEDAVNLLKESGSMRNMGDYQPFDMSLLTDSVGKILRTITYFISAVAGISLFIAGVGVMNMMYISVAERTKEIGVRRALGATEKAIRMQFLLEGLTLTLIGGAIGYILGICFAYIVGAILDISVSVDLFTISLAIGVSAFIGLVFSVVPASVAAKKDLIDILR
ncbi:ABC transporter permease [Clostridioides mangenotii]|uniref:ABC transporter permease n=1 Tax=Metaclostridioides mangenotii TaxID=1540 RepID=UPI001C0FB243|nr:ABC transporter permease [Clostridioides mangenotii]MBU5306763.1 ABC transporter permease [Clostridioides mangenotii]